MGKFICTLLPTLALLLGAPFAFAQNEPAPAPSHEHEHHHNHSEKDETTTTEPANPSPSEALSGIGIDENLGKNLPMDAKFTTSDGVEVTLAQLITKPVLLQPVFYSCSGSCSLILHSVATLSTKMGLTPGKDFKLLAISFDNEESVELARSKKVNFLKLAGEGLPSDAWDFVYGNQENIDKVMKALGFRYKKLGEHNYSHPNSIMAISPTGMISRYLYGATYQPFDASMALEEARKEHTGITVRKLLSICFTYEPEGNKYILNVSRLALILTLVVGLGFVAFLALGKRKPSHNKSSL